VTIALVIAVIAAIGIGSGLLLPLLFLLGEALGASFLDACNELVGLVEDAAGLLATRGALLGLGVVAHGASLAKVVPTPVDQ